MKSYTGSILKVLLFNAVLYFLPFHIHAQDSENIISFPGAEGFGRFATGGRGGIVIPVTNLNDDGPGSLREAVKMKEPRIVVFRVSGYIELKSPLVIKYGNITIAGQSAPGDGICLKNYPLSIHADNIIIRYIRSRLGDEYEQQDDAISVRFSKNVIIDHCSFSWAVDECASFYTNEDFTLQWCIISESLNNSVHRKGEHGYGGIWGGVRATFHHNLIAHHKSRNPRFSGISGDGDVPSRNVDFRNNVIYNWKGNSAYGGEEGEHNIVNNYYKYGPATPKRIRSRIINPSEPYGKFYVDGNYVFGDPKISENNRNGGIQCDHPEKVTADKPFYIAQVTTQGATEAFDSVLDTAGASHSRDSVDERLVVEVRNGTAAFKGSMNGFYGIIDSQKDVGDYPELEKGIAATDSDNDGMPDAWEQSKDLNPDIYDSNGRDLSESYDNIEIYLNELVSK